MKILKRFKKVTALSLFFSILSSALSPSLVQAMQEPNNVQANVKQANKVEVNKDSVEKVEQVNTAKENKENDVESSKDKNKIMSFLKKAALIAIPLLASVSLIGYLFKDKFKKFSFLSLLTKKNIIGATAITGGLLGVGFFIWKYLKKDVNGVVGQGLNGLNNIIDATIGRIPNVLETNKAKASEIIADAGTKFVNDNIETAQNFLRNPENQQATINIASGIVNNAIDRSKIDDGKPNFIEQHKETIKDITSGVAKNLVDHAVEKSGMTKQEAAELIKNLVANVGTKFLEDNKDKLPEIIKNILIENKPIVKEYVREFVEDNKESLVNAAVNKIPDGFLKNNLLGLKKREVKKEEPVVKEEAEIAESVVQEAPAFKNVAEEKKEVDPVTVGSIFSWIKSKSIFAEPVKPVEVKKEEPAVEESLGFEKLEPKIEESMPEEPKIEEKAELLRPIVQEVRLVVEKKEENKAGWTDWARNLPGIRYFVGNNQEPKIVDASTKEEKEVQDKQAKIEEEKLELERLDKEEKEKKEQADRLELERVAKEAKNKSEQDMLEQADKYKAVLEANKLDSEKMHKERLEKISREKLDREIAFNVEKVEKEELCLALNFNELEEKVKNKVNTDLDKKEEIEILIPAVQPIGQELKLVEEKKEEFKPAPGIISRFGGWIGSFSFWGKKEEDQKKVEPVIESADKVDLNKENKVAQDGSKTEELNKQIESAKKENTAVLGKVLEEQIKQDSNNDTLDNEESSPFDLNSSQEKDEDGFFDCE